jgi:hypothetical protein
MSHTLVLPAATAYISMVAPDEVSECKSPDFVSYNVQRDISGWQVCGPSRRHYPNRDCSWLAMTSRNWVGMGLHGAALKYRRVSYIGRNCR